MATIDDTAPLPPLVPDLVGRLVVGVSPNPWHGVVMRVLGWRDGVLTGALASGMVAWMPAFTAWPCSVDGDLLPHPAWVEIAAGAAAALLTRLSNAEGRVDATVWLAESRRRELLAGRTRCYLDPRRGDVIVHLGPGGMLCWYANVGWWGDPAWV